MKSIIPKALLEWKEPKAMRMAKDEMANRERSPWFKPGILLFIIAMIMVNWWLVQHDPQKTPPSFQNALLIALFGGIFFAYIVPWMLSFCPHPYVFSTTVSIENS